MADLVAEFRYSTYTPAIAVFETVNVWAVSEVLRQVHRSFCNDSIFISILSNKNAATSGLPMTDRNFLPQFLFKFRCWLALLCLTLAFNPATSIAQTTYTMIEAVGVLPGGTTSNVVNPPKAMNRLGQIVGGTVTAIQFDPSTSSYTIIRSLANGSTFTNSIGINGAGQVLGMSNNTSAVIRNPDGTVITLASPSGFGGALPAAMNEDGFSVGMTRDIALRTQLGNVASQRAILWDPTGNGTILPMLPTTNPWSYARGLNRVGQVVGQSAFGIGSTGLGATTHAFVATTSGIKDLHYTSDAPFISARNSAAYAINDAGTAVGQLLTSNFFEAPVGKAVIWKTSLDSYLVVGDPTLNSSLVSINNAGVAVGYQGTKAVVTNVQSGQLLDLETLVPSKPASVAFLAAIAINESGQIVVRGGDTASGRAGAYILTPSLVSAPTAPLAPTNLAASGVSRTQLVLNWTDKSNNETNFLIERSVGTGNTNFTQIATVGANTTTYTNSGLTRNTVYNYRIRAKNAVGNSAYSNTITVRTSL